MALKQGSSQSTAVLLALSSVLCWSFAATSFKKALEAHSPWFVVFSGSVVSAVVLLVILLARGKRVSPSDARRGVLYGFLNPFLYYLVLLHAYDGLPAQIAMVVNYLWPVVLVLLAVPFLGHKLTRGGFAGVFLSFSGVAVMALMGRSSMRIELIPLGLAFLSTVVWAVYWLLNTRSTGDTNAVLLMSFTYGSIYLGLAGAITGQAFTPAPSALPWLVYIGVFEMGVTYIMWNTAQKKPSPLHRWGG
ncbi:MAG TPA: DMT family transporter [Candidatus Sabulitectum sp.]|mgnify:FL=1|nr:DMT family transporter [Candidatus Sabulitectum sp.]